MEIRCNTDVTGARLIEPEGNRMVYLATSFVAEEDDGLIITGRIAADGVGGIGLQDIGLHMEPDAPLTPERLRKVPWSKILDQVLDHGAVHMERSGEGFIIDPDKPRPKGADMRRKRGGGRRRLDDDHYRNVAAIYRRSMAGGGDPVVSVMVDMDCKRPTAAGYVSEARKRGFLGPAPAKGQKGEA